MEQLPKKKLHGQNPVVTYCNPNTLKQFEAQARKGEPAQNGEQGPDHKTLYLGLLF